MKTTDQLAAESGIDYKGIESNSPWLGRCQAGCEFVLFSTTVASAERLRDVKADGRVFTLPSGYHCARCPEGHKPFRMKMVKGTYSPDHKCDSRCLNAKGHECTCACGGMNHGRGHAVAVITEEQIRAVAGPTYVNPTAINHIGEIGKYIVGEVKATSVTAKDGYTLHVFQTKSGDILKWFAPNHAGWGWQEGEIFKIRAKVKRHETHERFGKSTIVTYVERIEE